MHRHHLIDFITNGDDLEAKEASEEEVNKELQGLADRMKKSVDEIKTMMGARLTEMKEELTMEKTIDFLVENSKN